jgi:hypothetical protein
VTAGPRRGDLPSVSHAHFSGLWTRSEANWSNLLKLQPRIDFFDILGLYAQIIECLLLAGMAEGFHEQRHGAGVAAHVLPVAPRLAQRMRAVIALEARAFAPALDHGGHRLHGQHIPPARVKQGRTLHAHAPL